ncbi:MAG: hypothetical protein IJ710_04590 [Prevotella sp.]|nr:hypothetical protein [Prevotella sp.]
MKTTRYNLLLAVLLLLAGCSDELFFGMGREAADDADGIAFNVSVEEQAERIAQLGQTRAAADTALAAAYAPTAHRLEGYAGADLQVHRLTMPLVGIHQAPMQQAAARTRSTADPADLNRDIPSRVATTESFHDSITIWGYAYDAGGAGVTTLFDKVTLKKIRGWRSSVQWPYGKQKMRFYAISPALENMEVEVTSDGSYDSRPKITYTVPDAITAQRDLLYGVSQGVGGAEEIVTATGAVQDSVLVDDAWSRNGHLGEDDKTVDLKFRHILTAVRFAQGKMPTNIRIKSIKLLSILNKATYDGTKWTATSSASYQSYTITRDYEPTEWDKTGENVYIDGNDVLFLIPHTLTPDASLEVEVEEKADGRKHTLQCSLKNDEWLPGQTVTYKITIGKLEDGYYLIAHSPDPLEHMTTGYNGSFKIDSYRGYRNFSKSNDADNNGVYDNTTAANWEVEGFYRYNESTGEYDKIAQKPHWLESIDGAGGATTGGYQHDVNFRLRAQARLLTAYHSTVLQTNTSSWGGAESLDLSKYTSSGTQLSSQESSNCYIINRGGAYKFPIVYGNALGKSKDQFNSKNIFVDHAGQPIQYANIENQLENVAAHTTTVVDTEAETKTVTKYDFLDKNSVYAKLIWETCSGQIVVNDLEPSTHNIMFTVESKGLKPLNALIALCGKKQTKVYDTSGGGETPKEGPTYAEEEVLWAWHIWVTDEVYPNYESSYATVADDYEDDIDNYYGSKSSIAVDRIYTSYDGSSKIPEIENYSGEKNHILPVNLGWIPETDEWGVYQPREVWVKVKLSFTANTKIVKSSDAETYVRIRQEARQDLIRGAGTVYQWGRPTALPMVRNTNINGGVYGTPQPIIYSGATDITDEFIIQNTTSVADAIKHPKWLARYGTNDDYLGQWWEIRKPISGDPEGTRYGGTTYNFWGRDDDKTIYDPCPQGYRVPTPAVFTGLSLKGEGSENKVEEKVVVSNYLNMWPDAYDQNGTMRKSGSEKRGGYFYVKRHEGSVNSPYKDLGQGIPAENPWGIPKEDRYGLTYYLPSTGQWSNQLAKGTQLTNGALDDHSTGFYWTCEYNNYQGRSVMVLPTYQKNGKVLDFNRYFAYGHGLSLRPVKIK